MARKKKYNLTALKRIEGALTGISWDEAEEVGVEILARVLAFHAYAKNDNVEYFEGLMKKICERADEWAHEPDGIEYLALASVDHKLQQDTERNKAN